MRDRPATKSCSAGVLPSAASRNRTGCSTRACGHTCRREHVAQRDSDKRAVRTDTTAQAADVKLTADFGFDLPVRVDTDHIAPTIAICRPRRWQQMPMVEFRS